MRNLIGSRGIPSVILERHLQELALLFEEAFPERKSDFQLFRRLSLDLEESRGSFIAATRFEEVAKSYEAKFRSCTGLTAAHAV